MLNNKRMILAKNGEFYGNYNLLWSLLWDHQKHCVLCLEIWAAGGKNRLTLLENLMEKKYVEGEERKEIKSLRMLFCHLNLIFISFIF